MGAFLEPHVLAMLGILVSIFAYAMYRLAKYIDAFIDECSEREMNKVDKYRDMP